MEIVVVLHWGIAAVIELCFVPKMQCAKVFFSRVSRERDFHRKLSACERSCSGAWGGCPAAAASVSAFSIPVAAAGAVHPSRFAVAAGAYLVVSQAREASAVLGRLALAGPGDAAAAAAAAAPMPCMPPAAALGERSGRGWMKWVTLGAAPMTRHGLGGLPATAEVRVAGG